MSAIREGLKKDFKEIMDIISGRADVKSRIGILLDRDDAESSSRLNLGQVMYVNDAYWLALQYSTLSPLQEDADHLCKAMLSHRGWGVEKTIELQHALSELKRVLGFTSVLKQGGGEGGATSE